MNLLNRMTFHNTILCFLILSPEIRTIFPGKILYSRIEGSGRVRADPIVEATHPTREKPE
jgi:hypothetical protein